MKQKNYTRRLLAAAALIATLSIGSIGIGTSFAAEPYPERVNELVQAIAERFDLNVDDVQAIFDEYHAQMITEREEREAQKLSQAVANGKLTQEQADAIMAQRQEMKEFIESIKDLSDEERKEAMKQKMEENRLWAEENNIPLRFLEPGPHRRMRGFGPLMPDDVQPAE